MEDHILMPDDDERLSRVEYQLTRMNTILNGDRGTRTKGFIDQVHDNHTITNDRLTNIEGEVSESKILMKQIRFGLICFAVGVAIAGLIFGFIKLSDVISIAK